LPAAQQTTASIFPEAYQGGPGAQWIGQDVSVDPNATGNLSLNSSVPPNGTTVAASGQPEFNFANQPLAQAPAVAGEGGQMEFAFVKNFPSPVQASSETLLTFNFGDATADTQQFQFTAPENEIGSNVNIATQAGSNPILGVQASNGLIVGDFMDQAQARLATAKVEYGDGLLNMADASGEEESVNLASEQRTQHILIGDSSGGGTFGRDFLVRHRSLKIGRRLKSWRPFPILRLIRTLPGRRKQGMAAGSRTQETRHDS
jgi:hypothetical protein